MTQDRSAGHEVSPIGSSLSLLELECLDDDLFRGKSGDPGWQRVYGGQVLGQALMAAISTVDAERSVHSLHGYFLLGGDPKHSIDYAVDRLRDGGSFTTRSVKAIQRGRTIFVMAASFQKSEEGLDHHAEMPDVPAPEDLKSASELFLSVADKLPAAMRKYWEREQPIDMRPVDISRYLVRKKRRPYQAIWLKSAVALPDNPRLHQCVLAFASDFTLLDTALIAHGKLLFDGDMQLASLDHALWFHRSFRADEWMLYVQDSPSSFGARGFCRGKVFSRDGTLVASSAQEGLMRQRDMSDMTK